MRGEACKTIAATLIGLVAAMAAGSTIGQAYPDRPVRLIVGFPPGGAADILGRIAAQKLTDGLGQQVVVDNRGGAGGLINAELNKALQQPDLVGMLNSRGADAVGGAPEEFAGIIKADFAKWGKVVKDSGAKVD